jgi:hypothetical protein
MKKIKKTVNPKYDTENGGKTAFGQLLKEFILTERANFPDTGEFLSAIFGIFCREMKAIIPDNKEIITDIIYLIEDYLENYQKI